MITDDIPHILQRYHFKNQACDTDGRIALSATYSRCNRCITRVLWSRELWFFVEVLRTWLYALGEYVFENCTRGSFKFLSQATIDLQKAVLMHHRRVARAARLLGTATRIKNATKEKRRMLARSAVTKTNLRWEMRMISAPRISQEQEKSQPWILRLFNFF